MPRVTRDEAHRLLDDMLDAIERLAGVNDRDALDDAGEAAMAAYFQFGKGFHPARLNIADCFAYALAKSLNAPVMRESGHARADCPVRQSLRLEDRVHRRVNAGHLGEPDLMDFVSRHGRIRQMADHGVIEGVAVRQAPDAGVMRRAAALLGE